ncbi:MAG: phosphatidylserine decarboxylase [Deltaproteobacteria bacterium]|nr:phosphatidylserine decarboxylase [Deltaproteobacteria bacterium]
MKDALIVTALSVLPRKRGARAMGWGARTRVSRAVTRLFVRAYRIDLSEAEGTLADYPTLEALFTRTLKEGARAVDDSPGGVCSPVDGRVAALGRTRAGRLPLTDERALDLAALLGRELDGERDVIVLYLSPQDYHRVHVPVDGELVRWTYTPGTLWPVFPAALRRVDGLFSRNERVAVVLETPRGPVDAVLVGAFGVGRITLEGCELLTNAGQAGGTRDVAPRSVHRGDPLGVFHLGSTVILSLPPGVWDLGVAPGDKVRVGQRLGVVAG